MNEQDIIQLIREDRWMMNILQAAQVLNLPDWWICAGFVRSKVWDTLHGFNERTPAVDVDVIYYDNSYLDEDVEKEYEKKLRELIPDVPWSVKNEARMHLVNDIPPYTSCMDAMSRFPETATALGVKLDEQHNLVLAAPCGVDDVVNMVVAPTKASLKSAALARIYEARILKKNWINRWHRLRIVHID